MLLLLVQQLQLLQQQQQQQQRIPPCTSIPAAAAAARAAAAAAEPPVSLHCCPLGLPTLRHRNRSRICCSGNTAAAAAAAGAAIQISIASMLFFSSAIWGLSALPSLLVMQQAMTGRETPHALPKATLDSTKT